MAVRSPSLARREVASPSPKTGCETSGYDEWAPAAGGRRECVRKAGKSPYVGLGLHRTITDGHDPEDQREPCEQAFRSFNECPYTRARWL